MNVAVGNRVPAHCTALGKALLATLSEEEFDELYRGVDTLTPATPNSITDKRHLWEHLRKVRQDGVAYDFEENVIGGVCLGTVVRNYTGRPIAAMSISTPTQRLRREKLMTFREHLLEAARRLSAELGYQPVPSPRVPLEATAHSAS